MSTVEFKKGKRSRNELRLPTLHFIVADDWMDKLGNAFQAWLKFHTWVNRSESDKYDGTHIPYTMTSVGEKLGVSKPTLSKTIRTLWEYGLIDLVEYDNGQKGNKPVNIIVYEYPMNTFENAVKPLEKLRDWDKDYIIVNHPHTKDGGRKSNVCGDSKENLTGGSKENLTTLVKKTLLNSLSNKDSLSNNSTNDTNNQSVVARRGRL